MFGSTLVWCRCLPRWLIPTTGIGLTVVSTPVRAEPVTLCLAAASAIAGLIAANNRSDGGLSAVLQATLEYQRVMAAQLKAITSALADLYTKVAALPDEMRHALHEERLAELRGQIGDAAERYTVEVERSEKFDSYAAWQNNHETQNQLRSINEQVDKAVASIISRSWLDSMTALYVPTACSLILVTRVALKEPPELLVVQARRFSRLLQRIANPLDVSSTAADLDIRVKSAAKLTGQLRELGFVVPPDTKVGVTVALLQPLAIRDYEPATTKLVRTRPPTKLERIDGYEPSHPIEVPEVLKGIDHFVYVVDVEQVLVRQSADNESAAIRQYQLKGDMRIVRFARADYDRDMMAHVLSDVESAKKRFDDPTIPLAANRKEVWPTYKVVGSAPQQQMAAAEVIGKPLAEERRKLLEQALNEFNLQLAYIAQCLTALKATASADAALRSMFPA
jgi:hypothetical protein